MNDYFIRYYWFIVPYTLDGKECDEYGQYDFSLLNDNEAILLFLTEKDSPAVSIGDLFEEFTIKYHFLIDDGEYYYLNPSNCILLKQFIEDKNVLHIDAFKKIYNIVNEAIRLNTGIGLNF